MASISGISGWSDQQLTARREAIEKDPLHQYKYLKGEYKDVFTTGTIANGVFWTVVRYLVTVAVVVAVVGAVIAVILVLTDKWSAFSQGILTWFKTIDPIKAAIGGVIALTLIGGAAGIIARAQKVQDPILGKSIGAIRSLDDHLETVRLSYRSSKGEDLPLDAYIDRSTLTGTGKEKAFLYGVKSPDNHYGVSFQLTFVNSAYLAGTVFYDTLKTAVVPFYILFQWAREKITGKTLYPEQRPFELLDIPAEMGKTVSRIAVAPFYALAFLMAGFYSFVNPMGGRKLGAAIESEWNEDVPLIKGFWSTGGWQKASPYMIEGGGGPDGLGRNGFYLAGCWQPLGVAEFENGELTGAYYMRDYLKKDYSRPYQVITHSTSGGKELKEEYEAILTEQEKREKKTP